MASIRTVLVDDHPLLRRGVMGIISHNSDIDVVAEVGDGLDVLKKLPHLKPDIIIMEISLPKLDGIETTRRIHASYPNVKVIILTMHHDRQYAVDALQAGAMGYVLKGAEVDELLLAVESVMAGKRFLSPLIAEKLIDDFVIRRKESRDPYCTLSDREKTVMRCIAEGSTGKEMAESLSVSVSTVKKHKSNVMKKLGVKDMAGLIRIAIHKGLINDISN